MAALRMEPGQYGAVLRWLLRNSKRPQVAVAVWSWLFDGLRPESGEVTATRAALAERVGCSAGEVSRVLTALESVNAIRRQRDGRGVRVFVSPWVASHLPSARLEEARAAAGPLRLFDAAET